jgi:hypothetical protein
MTPVSIKQLKVSTWQKSGTIAIRDNAGWQSWRNGAS